MLANRKIQAVGTWLPLPAYLPVLELAHYRRLPDCPRSICVLSSAKFLQVLEKMLITTTLSEMVRAGPVMDR